MPWIYRIFYKCGIYLYNVAKILHTIYKFMLFNIKVGNTIHNKPFCSINGRMACRRLAKSGLCKFSSPASKAFKC